VGWVGAAFYALALVLLARGRASRRPATGGFAYRWLRPATSQGLLLLMLLSAQGARSYALFRRELPQIKARGGSVECHCKKWDDSMRMM
jgi:hypothetical protein